MFPRDDEAPIESEAAQRIRMEQEQENLDRQRRELERLREEFEAQQIELRQQTRANVPLVNDQQPRVNNADEITAIVSNIQKFHIEAKMPEFSDEMEKNPVEFLEEMEGFFKIKKITVDREMVLVKHALTGRAGLWIDFNGGIDTYVQFKELFLKEFYSISVRVQLKNKWMDRKYDARTESLRTYYYHQVKISRYFMPQLSDYEVNYSIIQQYPSWVQQSLASID